MLVSVGRRLTTSYLAKVLHIIPPSVRLACPLWVGSGHSEAQKLPIAGFGHENASVSVRFRLRFQPVDVTHWLNRSAGVSKFNVSLGLSLSRLATAFSLF